jgi:formylglycine-generating enzyme required for sulfatase activity
LPRYAWYIANSQEQTHPVGALLPNDFGLFDMLGNVHEWCLGTYSAYSTPLSGHLFSDRLPAAAPAADDQRVLRGGWFERLPRQVRSADRLTARPGQYSYQCGFRVARTEGVQTE